MIIAGKTRTLAEDAREARLPTLLVKRSQDRTGRPVYLVAVPHTGETYQITLRPKPRADGLNWLVFNGLGEFVCSRSSLLAARRKIAENNPIW